MKHFFTTLSYCCVSALLSAQPFWAQGVGGNDADETMDMCFDNAGNRHVPIHPIQEQVFLCTRRCPSKDYPG